MISFSKVFASLLLAAGLVNAFTGDRLSTYRTHEISPSLTIESYHPPSTYETFGEGIDHPLQKRADDSIQEAAISFVHSRLGVDSSAVTYKSGYAGQVASHAYLRQTHDGVPFANAVANVAFNKNNKIVTFGSSFVKPKSIASSTPTVSLDQAIATAEKALNGQYNQFPATLEYLAKDDGSAILTRVVQIRNEDAGTWYEAFIDAHSGELASITDFVARASYQVLTIEKEILTQGFSVATDPADLLASPNGWHNNGSTNTTTTSGNNVVSYKGTTSNTTAQSSATLNFIFTQNPASAPTVQANIDAARTNAFYVVNTVHDFTYRYGFTEAAFNFQTNNFGKGGKGSDAVTVSVQSTAGTNNADFSTPADGSPGAMRMFLWTLTSPQRDGALENDIVVHEMTHGVTNRMTGGGTGRCLQGTEAGGMGEGWSDAMADWTEKTSASVPDYVMGQYVINSAAGIRKYPYSTSTSVNPLRYSSVASLNEVHNIGEVWANTLHNVYAALVGAHGWSGTARTNPDGSEGNVVFLHLYLDALALQPCNPTFLTARDAWIQADANRYGGENKCLLWKAFASRGLGTAAAKYVDSSAVPSGC